MFYRLRENLGTRRIVKLPNLGFPMPMPSFAPGPCAQRESKVDVLLVNPPRGRRYLDPHPAPGKAGAAAKHDLAAGEPGANGGAADPVIRSRLSTHRHAHGCAEYGEISATGPPAYYLTRSGATLTNDMYGVSLAKSIMRWTMAFART